MINVEELRAKEIEHRKAANKIRAKIEKMVDEPEARKLVGKCFVYRNSYGSSRPSWNLYTRIVRADSSWVYVDTFEKDCDGKITFEFARMQTYSAYIPPSGYSEISGKVFQARRKQVIRGLQK